MPLCLFQIAVYSCLIRNVPSIAEFQSRTSLSIIEQSLLFALVYSQAVFQKSAFLFPFFFHTLLHFNYHAFSEHIAQLFFCDFVLNAISCFPVVTKSNHISIDRKDFMVYIPPTSLFCASINRSYFYIYLLACGLYEIRFLTYLYHSTFTNVCQGIFSKKVKNF